MMLEGGEGTGRKGAMDVPIGIVSALNYCTARCRVVSWVGKEE